MAKYRQAKCRLGNENIAGDWLKWRASGIGPAFIIARRNNPFTVATEACRALYNGLPVGSDALVTLTWSVGLTLFFAAISIRKFSRSTVA